MLHGHRLLQVRIHEYLLLHGLIVPDLALVDVPRQPAWIVGPSSERAQDLVLQKPELLLLLNLFKDILRHLLTL